MIDSVDEASEHVSEVMIGTARYRLVPTDPKEVEAARNRLREVCRLADEGNDNGARKALAWCFTHGFLEPITDQT